MQFCSDNISNKFVRKKGHNKKTTYIRYDLYMGSSLFVGMGLEIYHEIMVLSLGK